MREGWITLHRKFMDWEWYKEQNVKDLFLHLLLQANHKDRIYKGIEIKRGQHLTSYDNLSSETNLTYQNVRTALKKLEKTGELTVKSTNQFTLITVTKYDIYQAKIEDTNTPANTQLTDNQQTTNKQPNRQLTTNNNITILNNDNKETIQQGWGAPEFRLNGNDDIERNNSPPTLEMIYSLLESKDEFKYKPRDFIEAYGQRYFNIRTSAKWSNVNGKLITNWELDLNSWIQEDKINNKFKENNNYGFNYKNRESSGDDYLEQLENYRGSDS